MPDNNTRHTSSVALVLIDVINHFEFPDGYKLLKQALPMAARLARLKQRCRVAGIPAIYVNDNFGPRMAQHVRHGLSETHAMLLYHADDLQGAIEAFLTGKCGMTAVQVVGACRRRVEIVEEIAFVSRSFLPSIHARAHIPVYAGFTPEETVGNVLMTRAHEQESL